MSEKRGLARAERLAFQSRQYWASLPICLLPDHVTAGDGSLGKVDSSFLTLHFLLSLPSPLLQLLAAFPCYLPVEGSSQESRRSLFTELENGSLGKSGAFPISGPEPPSGFPRG